MRILRAQLVSEFILPEFTGRIFRICMYMQLGTRKLIKKIDCDIVILNIFYAHARDKSFSKTFGSLLYVYVYTEHYKCLNVYQILSLQKRTHHV